jgi:hypothetical protein
MLHPMASSSGLRFLAAASGQILGDPARTGGSRGLPGHGWPDGTRPCELLIRPGAGEPDRVRAELTEADLLAFIPAAKSALRS